MLIYGPGHNDFTFRIEDLSSYTILAFFASGLWRTMSNLGRSFWFRLLTFFTQKA